MLSHFFALISDFVTSSQASSYIPAIVFFLGFFETLGFVGLFLPIEIPATLALARFVHEPQNFGFTILCLGIGIFFGLIVGYFLGKTFLKDTFSNLMKKFPYFENELQKADKMAKNSTNLSFPIMINIGFVRPLISVYFGSHNFDHKKYIFSSFLGSLAYAIPRGIIGYCVGIFGAKFLDKFHIDPKIIIGFFVVIFLISLIKDFVSEKNIEKK